VTSFRSKLGSIVGWLGLCMGLTVAVAVPAGYLLVAYKQLDHQLSLLADLKAARLAKYIYIHRQLWQNQTLRLTELTEIPEAKERDAQQRIFDATGVQVLETGQAPAFPVMRRSKPVVVAGSRVAMVEAATTYRPIVISAAVVAAFSSVLGLAIFFVIKTIPQRIIDRTLAELQATQGRLLATIDAVPVEFIEFDSDKRMIVANRAARLSQGWSSDPVGKTMRELLQDTLVPVRAMNPTVDWDRWLDERVAAFDRGGMFEAARANGNFGRFYTTDLPGGGRVIVRVDITESKRREAELAAAQDRYRMLFDANSYPMVVIDTETRALLAVNDAAVAQYGWSREEALTMTSDDIYLPDDMQAVAAARRQVISNTDTQTIRGMRHRTKDGSIIDVELKVRSIKWEGKSAILITIQNVTERNLAELARKAAEEQLRQSQKMEVVGQLTGGIAHDFNNILMVILANADILQEEAADSATADRLEQISRAVERAADLTRQLLAFSRKQPLDPKRTDINKLVTGTAALLGRSLGDHIELKSMLAAPLWMTNVDQAQLEAALINLCVNARDAMPDGGQLRIETRNVTLDADYVARNLDAAVGDYVALAVTDTGSGMAPETLAKVFEPFFTTKEVGKGTGLGLSMVHGFIKQSNGHIKVASELGRGTCFTLYLPRDVSVHEESAIPRAPKLIGGRERILVVEDEAQVLASVVQRLQSLGYSVCPALDGAAGLACFEAAAVPYDLLLTDVMMPGQLNGKALAEAVLERWPATNVVFMSGYSEETISHDGRLDAGTLLLSKPFHKNDLAQIVRKALDAAKMMMPEPHSRSLHVEPASE
jgi:PAS domain S-box-containing protein